MTATYLDTGHVLDTGGFDGACAGDESHPWTPLTTVTASPFDAGGQWSVTGTVTSGPQAGLSGGGTLVIDQVYGASQFTGSFTFQTTAGTVSGNIEDGTVSADTLQFLAVAGTLQDQVTVDLSTAGVTQMAGTWQDSLGNRGTMAASRGLELTMSASPSSPTVGQTVYLTATLSDAAGYPIGGQPVNFGVVYETRNGVSLSQAAATTGSTGQAVVAAGDDLGGQVTFRASYPGAIAELTVDWSGTVAATRVVLSATPGVIPNNGSTPATITATVYGPDNRLLAGVPVTFSTDLGQLASTRSMSRVIFTDAQGQAADQLTARETGTATVTVAVYNAPPTTIGFVTTQSTLGDACLVEVEPSSPSQGYDLEQLYNYDPADGVTWVTANATWAYDLGSWDARHNYSGGILMIGSPTAFLDAKTCDPAVSGCTAHDAFSSAQDVDSWLIGMHNDYIAGHASVVNAMPQVYLSFSNIASIGVHYYAGQLAGEWTYPDGAWIDFEGSYSTASQALTELSGWAEKAPKGSTIMDEGWRAEDWPYGDSSSGMMGYITELDKINKASVGENYDKYPLYPQDYYLNMCQPQEYPLADCSPNSSQPFIGGFVGGITAAHFIGPHGNLHTIHEEWNNYQSEPYPFNYFAAIVVYQAYYTVSNWSVSASRESLPTVAPAGASLQTLLQSLKVRERARAKEASTFFKKIDALNRKYPFSGPVIPPPQILPPKPPYSPSEPHPTSCRMFTAKVLAQVFRTAGLNPATGPLILTGKCWRINSGLVMSGAMTEQGGMPFLMLEDQGRPELVSDPIRQVNGPVLILGVKTGWVAVAQGYGYALYNPSSYQWAASDNALQPFKGEVTPPLG
ncbi:MAG: Ig-like domain-containing protein [Thermaerobacter sp.]|nr:Ig-like domain-containing protein [Thermaerobacter sp.]